MFLLPLVACATRSVDPTEDAAAEDTATDTASEADADTDADADADADADTDTDTGTSVDYAAGDGPWRVSSSAGSVAGTTVTWYVPRGGTDLPVVVWSHGFGRAGSNHAAAAERAASWGFLVVVPDYGFLSDHSDNADFVVNDLIPEALARSEAGTEVALVGHSAGGLVSLLAAADLDVAAYVGLDAVDASGLGADAAASVRAPALFLDGEASSCNASGNATSWTTGGDAWRVAVVGATHCDFESDSDWLCETVCGEADSARQELVVEYAVAWLVHHLLGGADAWVEGSEATSDRSAGRIDW